MKNIVKKTAFAIMAFGLISLTKSTSSFAQTIGSVTDADGNTYKTMKIGSQTWMLENLGTTRYNDGTEINSISGVKTTNPEYTVHRSGSEYGNLYNWYAVKTGKLAPKGWHIPTEAEWKILEGYLGGANVAGGKLRMGNWPNNPNQNTFNVLPTGYATFTGSYSGIKSGIAYWWASSEKLSGGSNGAECRRAYMAQPNLHWGVLTREYFVPVRCVKN
jgi:uncharacterized protein (TIGR02145 family)